MKSSWKISDTTRKFRKCYTFQNCSVWSSSWSRLYKLSSLWLSWRDRHRNLRNSTFRRENWKNVRPGQTQKSFLYLLRWVKWELNYFEFLSKVKNSGKLMSTTSTDRSSLTNGPKGALSSRPSSSLVLVASSTFVEFFLCYACKFFFTKYLRVFLIIMYMFQLRQKWGSLL